MAEDTFARDLKALQDHVGEAADRVRRLALVASTGVDEALREEADQWVSGIDDALKAARAALVKVHAGLLPAAPTLTLVPPDGGPGPRSAA